ncbi:polysaccharide deacetylase family protein [Paenibacillus taiwanensis]|uniref:polysaccharide deacetylase family protein n=1 Tax=Paenibacillus taiwanensis TaxID=401638 RepID=UPI00068581EB|nr:polysaccharide deacetylase family protein [Paenibacillus taiwanensis]
MGGRNVVSVGRRRQRRNKKLIGRTILLFLIIAIGVGIYSLGQSLWGTTANAASEQKSTVVTEVAVIATAAKEKQSPTLYNGLKRKVAYLTFDDGPNSHTGEILDVLKQNNIKATFFMLGDNMRDNPDQVKRMFEEGHYPGLHSMTHNFAKLYKSGSSKNFIDEFTEAQGIVKEVTGFNPILIRAPYGSAPQIKEGFRTDIANAGFKMWDWTLDTLDWKYANNPSAILAQVKATLTEDTEVILMHDRKQTLNQLQQVIDYIRSEGYEFEVYNPNAHFVCNFHKDERL